MPTTGTEILQYGGNKALGLGGNAAIPALASIDNNIINQTGRDLMLLNHENNIKIYDQKIKDRGTQLQALADGKISTGEILDQDRPVVKKFQDDADKAFLKMTSEGGINNKEAYSNYMGKIRDLTDAVTHAQYRFLGRKQLEAEQSQQPLKSDQEAYANHLANQDKLGFFNGDYKPFQKSLDYDAEEISSRGWRDVNAKTPTVTTDKKVTTTANGKTTTKNISTTVPVKGAKAGVISPAQASTTSSSSVVRKPDGTVYQVTQSQVDFNKIRQNQIADYADDSGKYFENQTKHRNLFETAPDEVFVPYMNHIVQRVKDYNTDRELAKGDEGYLDPTDVANRLGIDPNTGKRTGQKIMMSTPDFAALTALADYNGSYAPKTETFLKDETEAVGKVTLEHIKAGAKIAVAKINKDGKIAVAKIKSAAKQVDETGLRPLFNDVVGMSKSIDNGKYGQYVVNAKDLPEGFQTFLGGLSSQMVNGKQVTTIQGLKPRADGTYLINSGVFIKGELLNPLQITEAKDAYNIKHDKKLSTSEFVRKMEKDKQVEIAPAYLIGDQGQKVDLNQVMDAQKLLIQPTVKKSEQVPTEITVENNYNTDE